MKAFLWPFVLIVCFYAGTSHGHFSGKGHVHTRSKNQQVFLNDDCRKAGTCDLKRFALTTFVYEVWFSDDPNHPTYGNAVIMEYETASVPALEKYVIVQFKKGCVFHSSKNGDGRIDWMVNDTVKSFGEDIPFCLREWVIDSQDKDPAYNSDPEYGRFYLLRWNRPGSYDSRTQKFYGAEKPTTPVVYMADYPSGAFVTGGGARNVALQFKTCIFRAGEVPMEARRNDLRFATPLACFDWQNVYIYDFATGAFRTDLAALPEWVEPKLRAHAYLIAFAAASLIAAGVVFVPLARRYRCRKRYQLIRAEMRDEPGR